MLTATAAARFLTRRKGKTKKIHRVYIYTWMNRRDKTNNRQKAGEKELGRLSFFSLVLVDQTMDHRIFWCSIRKGRETDLNIWRMSCE